MANVGLDFGTHQTKVCIEQGEDVSNLTYTFFTFKDLEGKEHYALPSTIQINKDDTLSYGFINEADAKIGRKREVPDFNEPKPKEPEMILPKKPIKKVPKLGSEKSQLAAALGMALLEKQYDAKYQRELEEWEQKCKPFEKQYTKALEKYNADRLVYERKYDAWKLLKASEDGKMIFRNFKQAFYLGNHDYPWPYEIKPEILSIWYLSYVLFCIDDYFLKLVEEGIGDGTYSLQVGVPTGKEGLKKQQKNAVRLFVSAFKLMDSFDHDFDLFKAAKLSELISKTEFVDYHDLRSYENDKYFYNINVFPEAYAGLFVLTNKGALMTGFNLLVDIGGGTTDVTFFTTNSTSNRPMIYNYDSVPKGLNYLIEFSMPLGWDKMSPNLGLKSPDLDSDKLLEAIQIYKEHLKKSTNNLQKLLWKERAKTTISKDILEKALSKRPVIYSGGGSMEKDDLRGLIPPAFTDIRRLDVSDWGGLYIVDLDIIKRLGLCPILSVSLGLAITQNNDNIDDHMYSLEDIFSPYKPKEEGTYDYGRDKDLQDL